jgi:PKD repeat protein
MAFNPDVNKWDLSTDIPGILENKTILWAAGSAPSKTNPRSFDLAKAAFQAWASVPGSLIRAQQVQASGAYPDNAAQNLVAFDTQGFGPNELARTGPVNDGNGKTLRVVIVINDNLNWSSDGYLYAVILHEVGHALGLAHSDDASAIMYYQVTGPKSLGADDRNGIRFLYPDPNYVYSPPVAVIDGSTLSGAAPFAAFLSGTGSTGDITKYSWSYGDGSSGEGQTSSHTYSAGGEYDATLTVTDSSGATSAATVHVSVSKEVRQASVQRATFSVDFARGRSSLSVTICNADFAPKETAISVLVGGVSCDCKFRTGRGKAVITSKAAIAPLQASGLTDSTTGPLSVPVSVEVGTHVYSGVVAFQCSAKSGKVKGRQ